MKKKFTAVGILSALTLIAIGLAVGPFAATVVPGSSSRINVASGGAQATSEGFLPAMSRDGRFVAFATNQDNFGGTDWGGDADVFVRNLAAGTVTRVSVSTAGVQADASSALPAISETGRYMVFGSTADTNGLRDIFTSDTGF